MFYRLGSQGGGVQRWHFWVVIGLWELLTHLWIYSLIHNLMAELGGGRAILRWDLVHRSRQLSACHSSSPLAARRGAAFPTSCLMHCLIVGSETSEPCECELKPLRLWVKINFSSFKLLTLGIFAQDGKLAKALKFVCEF